MSRTAQVCFYHLRRLRSVRRSQLGRDVVSRRLFSALIHPVAIGLLQRYRSRSSGLNIGTVLSSISGHATYVTPALRELHWLPLLISHENWLQVVFAGPQVIHWSGAGIHCWHAHGCSERSVTGYTARRLERRLTNSWFGDQAFQSLLLELGIGYRLTWRLHRARRKCLNAVWKYFCF